MAEDCLRCRGTLKADDDRYGAFLSCIQCGYVRDLPAKLPLNRAEMVNARRQRLIGIQAMGPPLLNLWRRRRVSPGFRERVRRLARAGLGRAWD